MKKNKLTNEIVDERLAAKSIQRLDPYITNSFKIKFKCLIEGCNYIWTATPAHVMLDTGCPKCGKNARYSNEFIDTKLVGRTIKRIENYINSNTKIKFQCLKEDCKYVWENSPSHIIHGEQGCPKCKGLAPLTDEEIDNRLIHRNIKRLDSYIKNNGKLRFQCLHHTCSNIWKTTANKVINQGTGCPKCTNHYKFSNEEIDEKLIDRNIKRLDDYINCDTKIKFQCMTNVCNHIWQSTTYLVINGEQGCPACYATGNESLIHKLLSKNNIAFDFHKNLRDINNSYPRYYVDFYFPCSTIIEYNGAQHYMPVCFGNMSKLQAEGQLQKQKQRDLNLEKLCKDNGITLIWIDGRYFKGTRLEKLINEIIIPLLGDKK